jgi:2-dehydropantoate 2-reductase
MQIKKVALIGAGAVGAYFIEGLAEMLQDDFCVLADGKRKERLERDGLIINERPYKLNVRTPEQAGEVDLLLVASKYNGLFHILDDIEKVVGPQTMVMSLLNGIDSETIIGERIGMQHMVYALMRISSEREENRIHFNPDKTLGLFFGEKDTKEKTERIQAIEDLLSRTSLHFNFVKDIVTDQWKKYALNIGYNLPQALLGVGFGAYFDSEHVAFMRDQLLAEVGKVALAKGIVIPELGVTRGFSSDKAHYSTLQDIEAGRETEIEMFLGVLIKLAKDMQIEVPVSQYTYHAIKALEEKNSGKIF